MLVLRRVDLRKQTCILFQSEISGMFPWFSMIPPLTYRRTTYCTSSHKSDLWKWCCNMRDDISIWNIYIYFKDQDKHCSKSLPFIKQQNCHVFGKKNFQTTSSAKVQETQRDSTNQNIPAPIDPSRISVWVTSPIWGRSEWRTFSQTKKMHCWLKAIGVHKNVR